MYRCTLSCTLKEAKDEKKTITKLLDKFMNRRVEFWNDKEIATTLAESGAIRTAVEKKVWSKIPRN